MASLSQLGPLAEEQTELAYCSETANFRGLLAQFDARGRMTRKRTQPSTS